MGGAQTEALDGVCSGRVCLEATSGGATFKIERESIHNLVDWRMACCYRRIGTWLMVDSWKASLGPVDDRELSFHRRPLTALRATSVHRCTFCVPCSSNSLAALISAS